MNQEKQLIQYTYTDDGFCIVSHHDGKRLRKYKKIINNKNAKEERKNIKSILANIEIEDHYTMSFSELMMTFIFFSVLIFALFIYQ